MTSEGVPCGDLDPPFLDEFEAGAGLREPAVRLYLQLLPRLGPGVLERRVAAVQVGPEQL